MSCDPTHDLKLENLTGNSIEVLYSLNSRVDYFGKNKTEIVEINGRELNKIKLDSAEILRIGNVVASYVPRTEDIYIDYLEIQSGSDTIKLTGKHAILSTIQKVKRLDWRLIIK
jgi:hypothetical protein